MARLHDWAGRLGLEWADKTERFDRLLGPLGEVALWALQARAGERVLDVGCGAGATSLALADRGAVVTGVDVSEHLLDVARTRDADGRCTFIEGDAASVEFARRFDAIFSRCGMMFFDDPVAAFRHLRAAMRPEARLAMVSFRSASENGWVTRPFEILAPVLGEAATAMPENGVPGPFAWADPDHFRAILEGAGWQRVTATPIDQKVLAGGGDDPVAEAVGFCEEVSLVRRLRDLSEEERDAVRDALGTGLEADLADGEIRFGTAGWVIEARAR